jgi:hypothetical protein
LVGAASATITLVFEPADFARRGLQFSSQSFVDTSLLLMSVGSVLTMQAGSEVRDRFERSRCALPLLATAAGALGRAAGLALTVLIYALSITLVGIALGNPIEPYFPVQLALISGMAALTLGAWSSAIAPIQRTDVRSAIGIGGLFVLLPRLRDVWWSPSEPHALALPEVGEPWIPAALTVAGVTCLTLAMSQRVWGGLDASVRGTVRLKP